MLASIRHHAKFSYIGIVLFEVVALSLAQQYAGQQYAPGVPPQHYDHPQQQQYNPNAQQQQFGQPNVQQQQYNPNVQQQQFNGQQPNVQQQYGQPQQQQQQYGQQPPQPPQQQQYQPPQQTDHGHGHGGHGGGHGGVLTGNVNEEKDHIKEHMEVPIDTSKMTEQELQFHYFTMHDSDKNNKLDGSELIKSLIHWHEQGSKEHDSQQNPQVEEKIFTDDELTQLIDPILKMDDTSNDGYIDYPEFIRAQQKAAAGQHQQPHQQPSQHL